MESQKIKQLDLTWAIGYGNDVEIMHYATNRQLYDFVLKQLMKNIHLKDVTWVDVDWEKYEERYYFDGDYEGYADYVGRMFEKSILSKYKFIIFDRNSPPILKINMKYFFEHCWEIITSNGQGVYAFTEDAKYIIECRNHSIIHSNFPIFDEDIHSEFSNRKR